MSEEKNIRQCKICLQLKERVLQGKFNLKDKKWTDPEGKLWNGNVCPACNKERVKNHMKALRISNVSKKA